MTPAQLLQRLDGGPLWMDGAMGSELIARGLAVGRAPEFWLFEHPERVAQVHAAYWRAGADIVQTNTFGGTPVRLEQCGLGGRCDEVNRTAARIARDAVSDGVLVAGNVGPTGLFLPPKGTADPEDFGPQFAAQAHALAAGGVDLLSIETMYDSREALAAVRAAAETGLAVMASMMFDQTDDGFATFAGDRPQAALQALVDAGATVVGFNCALQAGPMLGLLAQVRAAVTAPILCQPNGGLPRQTPEGFVYDAQPQVFARQAARLFGGGASVVGGCCGIGPDCIAAAQAGRTGPGS